MAKKQKKQRGAMKAHDHATGTGFKKDKSTTAAVLHRMQNMQYWLRGESPPLLDDPRRRKMIT